MKVMSPAIKLVFSISSLPEYHPMHVVLTTIFMLMYIYIFSLVLSSKFQTQINIQMPTRHIYLDVPQTLPMHVQN